MNYKTITSLSFILLLAGCETLQSPRQRQQQAVREQAANRVAEERMYKVQGQVESVEMQYSQLMQEIQQLREQVRAGNSQISQLNSRIQALEAKQAREMQETIDRVKQMLGQAVAARPATQTRGAGREHVVEKGHTLSTIAQAYGTTVDAIKKANNLKSDTIRIGQKLFIPE